jgi:4-amino-4-deoxy-L-arabinose transferase-like glycosyltransferase
LFIPATIVVVFVLISGSQFKLPHYLNVLFPLFAIHLAFFLTALRKKWDKLLGFIQGFVAVCVMVLIALLNGWSFPLSAPHTILVTVVLGILLVFFLIRYRAQYRTITLLAAAILYFDFTYNVFPEIMKYQAGNVLADVSKEALIPGREIRYLAGQVVSNSFDFHLGTCIPAVPLDAIVNSKKSWTLYTDEAGLHELVEHGVTVATIAKTFDRRVSKLDRSLLDPTRRRLDPGVPHYLVKIN